MDLGLLVIFLVGGTWFYASALLALADWRWNLGRVVAFGLFGALSVWPALNDPGSVLWIVGLLGLFLLTVLLPHTLSRRVKRLVSSGRIAAAGRVEMFHALLTFQSPDAARRRLEEADRVLRHEWALAGRAAKEDWFQRFRSAWSRRGFMTIWIEGLVNIRENAQAVRVFEENFGRGRPRANSALLYVMVAPYAKLGEIRRALDCLRRADRGTATAGTAMRRCLALLHLYAFAGRPESVDRLIARTYLLQAALPPAVALLWRGVALMRRGDLDGAREEMERAREYPAVNPRLLDAMVRRYLTMLSRAGAPVALDPALARDLDDLESSEERVRPEPLLLREERIVATPAIMIACAAVWLTMGFGTATTDPIELIRYGANVSGLVKTGEWWRLVSSIFLHVGILHLVFNMWACHIFGSFVERLSGRWAVLVGFVVSGIVGSAASAFLGSHTMSAGASGGVFGLLGMAIILTLFGRKSSGELRRMQLFTFLFFAGLNAAYGLMQAQIDNLAHAGGLAGGLAVGLLLCVGPGARWKPIALRLAAVCCAVILAATAVEMVRSVRGGAYPRRITSWRTYTSLERDWTLEVPSAWEVAGESREEVVFQDPLETRFQVLAEPKPRVAITPVKGERISLVERRTIRAHGMEYEEMVLIVRGKETKLARFIFLLHQGDRAYLMVLECEEEFMPLYRPLAERLPLTFMALTADADAAAEAPASAPPASAPPAQ
jgi:rhomboid protease GluP